MDAFGIDIRIANILMNPRVGLNIGKISLKQTPLEIKK
tara:strand:- start:1331 stop:1444 length:114 start_codon:yes stop_codon:yes gene_type:complete